MTTIEYLRVALRWFIIIMAWVTLLCTVWPVQYILAIPLDFVWRVIKASLLLGLLFCTLIGIPLAIFILWHRSSHGKPLLLGPSHVGTTPLLLARVKSL